MQIPGLHCNVRQAVFRVSCPKKKVRHRRCIHWGESCGGPFRGLPNSSGAWRSPRELTRMFCTSESSVGGEVRESWGWRAQGLHDHLENVSKVVQNVQRWLSSSCPRAIWILSSNSTWHSPWSLRRRCRGRRALRGWSEWLKEGLLHSVSAEKPPVSIESNVASHAACHSVTGSSSCQTGWVHFRTSFSAQGRLPGQILSPRLASQTGCTNRASKKAPQDLLPWTVHFFAFCSFVLRPRSSCLHVFLNSRMSFACSRASPAIGFLDLSCCLLLL